MRGTTKFWVIVSGVFVLSTLIASLIAFYYKTKCASPDASLIATSSTPRDASPPSEVCQKVQSYLHNDATAFGEPGIIVEIDSAARTIKIPLPNASHIVRASLPDEVPPESGSFYLTHIDCELSTIRIHPVWNLPLSKEIKVAWSK